MSSVTFHGRDRGYGSGYGRNSTPRSRKQSAQQAPPPPQGEVLATIYPVDLQAEKQGITAQITDSQCLTSYNWLGGGEPHILIPGKKAYPQRLPIAKGYIVANQVLLNR